MSNDSTSTRRLFTLPSLPLCDTNSTFVPPSDSHTTLSPTAHKTMMKAAVVLLLAVSAAAQEKGKFAFYGEAL